MNETAPAPAWPKGTANAFFFQIFNCTSWSLVLGTPMLLYLKQFGASALVLGITVAMIPLFGALQIPAANYVERVGFKNFVVRGWTSRSIFILGIFGVAMLPDTLSPQWRIILVLLNMGLFAAARGISVCGYMPWITHLVPESLRGRYISRESMCMNLALTGTMLLSSWWVALYPQPRAFAALFMVSYVAALGSLVFLKRIPDVQVARPTANSAVHPPWKAMLLHPPFFRFIVFNVCFTLFISALGVVWVPFMKDGFGASGSLILTLSAYSSIIGAIVAPIVGPVTDRTGSRPLLAFSSALIIVSQLLWMTLAAGALPRHPIVPFLIVTIGAIGYPMSGLAATRLLMGLVPVTGRSHFFAISSVSASLTLGLMPILWGLWVDALGKHMGTGLALGHGWTWNAYSLTYAAVAAGTLFSQIFRRRLDEPKAMSTEEFLRILLIQSPARIVTRTMASFRRFLPPG